MKKTNANRRLLALVLALALILSTVPVNTAYAASTCDCKDIVKLTVKTTGKTLLEGQPLTKSAVKNAIKVKATYESGKQKAKYTSYHVQNLNKIVKPAKNGKFKVSIKAGNVKKKVSVKVNRIKKIYIKQSKQTVLSEGRVFDKEEFKKKTIVMASYKKGPDKKLTSYTVEAPRTVTVNQNGEFVVKVKYGNKKDSIAIPVSMKQLVTTEKTTEVPTTEKPTTEAPTTEKPTTEAPTTETPTTETPTTEAPTTEEPTTEEPTPVKTVDITVTKNGDGKVEFNNDTISGEAVTKTVEENEKCTLTATNTSDYKFVHWVDAADNSILSTEKEYTFLAKSSTKILAVFEKVYTLSVYRLGGKGKVKVESEEVDFYNDVATYKNVVGRYSLEAISTDDYNFVSWTSEDGKVLSTDPSYDVALTDNVKINANFAETEKTVNVEYWLNDQLIASEAVYFGETLAAPTQGIWKADKVFSGWKIGDTLYSGVEGDTEFYDENQKSLSDAIKALTAQKKNVKVEAYYTDKPVEYFSVNITDGDIVSYDDGSINQDGAYSKNTHLYIKANVPEGKFFTGWSDESGNIISYEEEYDFFLKGNVVLTATFDSKVVEKEPIVHFTGSKYELHPESNGVKLFMASEIPEGYTKIQWGFLYTKDDLTEDEMVVGGAAKRIINDSTVGNADWTYNAQLPQKAWDNQYTMKFRIFATVQSAAGTKTIYSEIVSVQLTSE